MGGTVDREAPWYFMKSAHSLTHSGATVPYPPGTSNFHHEIELVVAIDRPAFRVPKEDAMECVFGYATGLDMTRRDLQQVGKDNRRPWDFGKDIEKYQNHKKSPQKKESMAPPLAAPPGIDC